MNRMVFLLALLVVARPVWGQPDKGLSVAERGTLEAEWYPQSHAVVVGIDKYSQGWPRLQSAVRDARNMAAALEKRGFEVVVLLDQEATREKILEGLRDTFRKKSGPRDRFVFYFSGHGQDIESPRTGGSAGYLVPYDGRISDGEHVLSSYVSMKELRDSLLDLYESRHILVVADSCFSGLLASRSGLLPSASVLAHLAKQGVNVLSAGESDQAAVDGLFTDVLIRGLDGEADADNDGFVSFGELGLYVQQDVSRRSDARQTPYYGHLSGGQGQIVFEMPSAWARLVVSVFPEGAALELVGPGGGRRTTGTVLLC